MARLLCTHRIVIYVGRHYNDNILNELFDRIIVIFLA